jgi:hypothetical protein
MLLYEIFVEVLLFVVIFVAGSAVTEAVGSCCFA